ncbi:MAG: hypothetical protein IH600_03165 [Bacteroidetes bacterium]|nr:hypothetical protein [Bacteroidota bacterium]
MKRRPAAAFAIALVAIAGMVILQTCSNTSEPPVPPDPDIVDTTTHDYSWEYHFFNDTEGEISTLRDIQVVDANDIWFVGEIYTDTLNYSIPNRWTSRFLNVLHWDGKAFTTNAYEAIIANGDIGRANFYAVTARQRSNYLISGLGITELNDDSMVFHDMRILNGKWNANEMASSERSGSMFIHGRPGFLAELVQAGPLQPIGIRQIPLPTQAPVRAFVEVGEQEYFIGVYSDETGEHHWYHSKDGSLLEYSFSPVGVYSRDYCTALWASENKLFATTTPFLFVQSLADTSDRVFIDFLDDLGRESIGRINRMTGLANNDIFFVGEVTTVMHYNGKSFRVYDEIKQQAAMSRFYDVAMVGDKVYIVGGRTFEGRYQAALIIGTKR